MAAFTVELANDRIEVIDADAYQHEGPMTTFFTIDSSRAVIDSWSRRIASFRTADVVMVLQTSEQLVAA